LASVIATLGGAEFPRVRLGIGDPQRELAADSWSDFVLEDFPSAQEPVVDELVAHAADAVAAMLDAGVDWAASRFNRRRSPAGSDRDDILPDSP
jgi:PTH1 family peptidyl-tRNA hydrolase